MRLLHVTSGSDAGGVSRYLCDLCAALKAAGHDVTLAGRRGAWHELFKDCNWIEVPINGGPLALRRAAKRLAREKPFDLVHAHYRKSAIVARRCGAPVLFTLHLTGIPMGFVRRSLTDFGDVTHAPSLKAKQWLIETAGVPADRIAVIPHGVDPRKFPRATDEDRIAARDALGLPHDATVAAYVGRFDEPKNEQWIVDAAGQNPHVRFVMMGDGPRKAALRDAPVTLLPYGDPLPVYRAADALLLPSSQEGFSLMTAEAMSVGRPVLRTRTAGVDETIVENATGLSCAVDRDAFLSAAKTFLADRTQLHAMGERAAAHVREHLRYDQQVERTIELYERMLTS